MVKLMVTLLVEYADVGKHCNIILWFGALGWLCIYCDISV